MKVSFNMFFFLPLLIISTVLLPMDPPDKEKCIGNFKILPNDIFLQRFIIESEPEVKNLLGKTSRKFNGLLSCKKVKSFMLCKELNVCEIDFLKVFFTNAFNQEDNAINILQKCYPIKKCENVFSYCCMKAVDILKDNGTVFSLLLDKNNMQKILEAQQVNPFFVACLFSKTESIEKCITDIGQKFDQSLLLISEGSVKILLHAIIYNNHQNALAFVLKQTRLGKKIKELSEELIQLVVYYARPDLVEELSEIYKNKIIEDKTKQIAKGGCETPTVDYIGRWLLKEEECSAAIGQYFTEKQADITDKSNLLHVIKTHHNALLNKNNVVDYNTCCKMILDDRDYRKLNKKEKEEKADRKEKCLLQ